MVAHFGDGRQDWFPGRWRRNLWSFGAAAVVVAERKGRRQLTSLLAVARALAEVDARRQDGFLIRCGAVGAVRKVAEVNVG